MEAASKERYFDNTVFLFVRATMASPAMPEGCCPAPGPDQRLTAEHVPLLIYAPKLLPAERFPFFCSQLDVLPTLAGLCRIPYSNTTLGRDLMDTTRNKGKELSFIYDPDQGYIGVVQGDYFYRRQLKTGKEELVSVVNNEVPAAAVTGGPVKRQMRQLSEGLYETARYMLLKNKKR